MWDAAVGHLVQLTHHIQKVLTTAALVRFQSRPFLSPVYHSLSACHYPK